MLNLFRGNTCNITANTNYAKSRSLHWKLDSDQSIKQLLMKLLMTAAKAAAMRVMKMLRKRTDRPCWEFAIAHKQRNKCAQRQCPARHALSSLNFFSHLSKTQWLTGHTRRQNSQIHAPTINSKLTGAGCLFIVYNAQSH